MGDPSLTSTDSGAAPAEERQVEFVCNLCGRANRRPASGFGRETPSCESCGSTVRLRALIHLISEELLGTSIALPDFPRMKGIRGIGMSDTDEFAALLAEKFDYTNTFYHKEPHFDIVHMDERDLGGFDFIISSEVLEHVPPPVEKAFATLQRMLKPRGILFLTVPYTLESSTEEHFPELHDYALAELDDRLVLVNRTAGGDLQVFDNLVFHGGGGSTLEMRRFSESALRGILRDAGFSTVRIAGENHLPFGVYHNENWSLPIAARKEPFLLTPRDTAELALQFRDNRLRIQALEKQLAALQGDFEKHVAWAERTHAELQKELADRTEWAHRLESQLSERTEWALSLERDVKHHVEIAGKLQSELDERTKWALDLEAEVGRLRAELARLRGLLWIKAGRLLRFVR